MLRITYYLQNTEGDVKFDRFQVMRDKSRETIVPVIRAFIARQRQ